MFRLISYELTKVYQNVFTVYFNLNNQHNVLEMALQLNFNNSIFRGGLKNEFCSILTNSFKFGNI